MEILFVWAVFAIIVGVAANTRGRSGFGWFLLAVIISPLLAGLLVLALPRLSSNAGEVRIERRSPDQPSTQPSADPGPFEPDAVFAGVPYKVLKGGAIDAMLQGGLVRFRDMDQFMAATNGKTVAHPPPAG